MDARPNFMKIAPLIMVFQRKNIEFELIHTGQHKKGQKIEKEDGKTSERIMKFLKRNYLNRISLLNDLTCFFHPKTCRKTLFSIISVERLF